MVEGSKAIALVQSLLPILGIFVGITVALGLAIATWRYFKPGDGDSHRARWGNDALRIVGAGVVIAILASTNAGRAAFNYLGRGVTSYFESASTPKSGTSALMPSGDDYQVQQGQAREISSLFATSESQEMADASSAAADETSAEIEANNARLEEIYQSTEDTIKQNYESIKDSSNVEDLTKLLEGVDTDALNEASAIKQEQEENYWKLFWQNYTTAIETYYANGLPE